MEKLMYISQGETIDEHLLHINEVLEAGAKWIQLRLKDYPVQKTLEAAHQVRMLCDKYKAIFIMNDWVEIAKEAKADGVHIGKEDIALSIARKTLGKDSIIGVTANTLEDIESLDLGMTDYIGLGPFRFTNTKQKLSPILGLNGYQDILKNLGKRGISIPVYAIGGIEMDDFEALNQTGIAGIAVSGLLTRAKDKKLIIQTANKLNFTARI